MWLQRFCVLILIFLFTGCTAFVESFIREKGTASLQELSLTVSNLPDAVSLSLSHSVVVTSTTAIGYLYKSGSESTTNCSEESGYSTFNSINSLLNLNVSLPLGSKILCIRAVGPENALQRLDDVYRHTWNQSWSPFIYIEKPGQQIVSSATVSVKLHASSEFTEVYLTENSNCSTGGIWEPYAVSKSFNLTPDLNRTGRLYAIFKTAQGTLSPCVSDEITVGISEVVSTCAGVTNSTAPTGLFIDSGGAGAPYTNGEACSIQLSGGPKMFTFNFFKTEQGYDFIRIYQNSETTENLILSESGQPLLDPVLVESPTQILRFNSDGSVTDDGYSIGWSTPSLEYSLAMVIDNNADVATSTSVNLNISQRGQFTEMYVTDDPVCASGGIWEDFQSLKAWTLPAGDGSKSVYIKFRDPSLLETSCESDSILLFTQALPIASLSGTPVNNSGGGVLDVTVGGATVTKYKFKFGLASATDCSVSTGYSAPRAIATKITSSLNSYSSFLMRLCVLGVNALGVSQSLSAATVHDWQRLVPQYIYFASSGELVPEGTASVTFILRANAPAVLPISVEYDFYGDFVTSNSLTSGTAIIPIGQTDVNITVNLVANPVQNTDRRLSVGIRSISSPHLQGVVSTSSKLIIDAQRPIKKVQSIGDGTNCAVMESGELVCRGDVGGYSGATLRFAEGFQQFASSENFKEVIADRAFKCALSQASELYCWGNNSNGQLGQGNTSEAAAPLKVNGFTWKVVKSSGDNVCGIDSNDDLYCWGDQNSSTRFAGNGTGSDSTSPTLIDGANKFSFISMGTTAACAITLTTNILKCWGPNNSYTVGNGTNTFVNAPTTIDAGVQYAKVFSGFGYSSGITTNGDWKYWGSKIYDGSFSSETTPITIDSSRDYTDLVLTDQVACGLAAGKIYCIGNDYFNYLGLGNYFATPAPVDAATTYVKIVGSPIYGDFYLCGLTVASKIKCFGAGLAGTSSSASVLLTPMSPTQIDQDDFSNLISVTGGTCAITTSGVAKCMTPTAASISQGSMITQEYRQTEQPRQLDSTLLIESLSGSALVGTDGKIYEWGASRADSTSFARRTNPFLVQTGFTDVVSISKTQSRTCFIRTGGQLYCKGDYAGDGTASAAAFVHIDSAVTYRYVKSMNNSTCAITTADELKCWGQNLSGELGVGDQLERLSPTVVGTDFKTVDFGRTSIFNHTCAVKTTGELFCWGRHFNSIGNGSTSSNTPVEIAVGTDFLDVAVGATSCAIRSSDQRVMCWGRGAAIGNGATPNQAVPTLTSDTSSYTSLYACDDDARASVCGVTGGDLKCWGFYKGYNTQALVPTLTFTGTAVKDVVLSTNYYPHYIVDSNGKLYHLQGNNYTPFGQHSYFYFEPLLGLVDRTFPIFP